MTWSICVPTVPARRNQRACLLESLEQQVEAFSDIELLVLEDNRARQYGPKLQAMIDIAQGEWLSFVDDDDRVADDYVQRLRAAMEPDPDCVGMVGLVTFWGPGQCVSSLVSPLMKPPTPNQPPREVHYSIEHRKWCDLPTRYLRNPQHITPIRTSLIRQVPWAGHYGADRAWSTAMASSGLLRTERFVPSPPVYFYDVQTDNRAGVWT